MKRVQFERLYLKGFKVFGAGVSLTLLDPRPLLIFLTGDNRESPELGANAVGKSTLFDGLCWVLYGVTSKGVRAAALSHDWSGASYWGEVTLSVSGVPHTIRRTWKPNGVLLDGARVSQPDLNSLIGLKWEGFINTVIIPQSGQRFSDLQAAQKERLLSELLGLDYWLALSSEASAQAAKAGEGIARRESEIRYLSGKLESLGVEGVEEEYKEWEEQRAKRVAGLDQTVQRLRNDLQVAHTVVQDARRRVQKARDGAGEGDRALVRLERRVRAAKSAWTEADRRLAKAGAKWDQLQASLRQVGSLSGGTCTQCGQPVSPQHAREEQDRLEAIANQLSDKIREIEAEVEKLDTDVRTAEGELAQRTRKQKELGATSSEWERRLARYEAEMAGIERDLDRAKRDVGRAEGEENPVRERLEKVRSVDRAVRHDLSREKVLAYFERRTEEGLRFWVKGFKEIRFLLLQGAVSHLEQEVGAVLASLGLPGWSMQFVVEEGASGQSSLKTLVTCPGVEDPVPWESWSGGEEQRLRLATIMGLASMLHAFAGVRYNVEFWDEPTTHLSTEGVAGLMETLYYRARDLRKSVWVVDHNAIQFSGVERTLRVVRDGSSSKVLDDFGHEWQ